MKLRPALFFGVLVTLAVVGCNLGVSFPQRNTNAPVATDDSRLEQQFVDSIAVNVDLNSGITLVRPSTGISIGNSSGVSNDVTFMLQNHTDEPIVFPDQAFGLMVFWADTEAGKWQNVELRTQPDPSQKTLPPRLERYDAAANNMWSVFPNEFMTLDHLQVRLYVQGVGTVTGKKYGAYLDAVLKP